MGVFLTTLQRLKIPSENVRLILNKAEENVGIEVDQVVKLFPQGFSSVLPYSREVSRSINLGMPVLAASPGSDVCRKLAEGMTPLLPDGVEMEPIADGRSTPSRLAGSSVRRDVAVTGGAVVKLSEKLAVIEDDERPSQPAPTRRRTPLEAKPAPKKRAASRRATSASTWEESKRQVRARVLAEVSERAGGLTGDSSPTRSVRRSTASSPPTRSRSRRSSAERSSSEVLQDTLGFGAARAAAARRVHHRDHVQRPRRHLGGAQRQASNRVDVTFDDEAQYRWVIEKIVSSVGRRVDEGSPMVDARLPDGSRVNAILPPLAMHGPALTIRKFAAEPFRVQDLIRFGTLHPGPRRWCSRRACAAGSTCCVSGGTGTGKTTVLNVLSSFIPDDERIITIEDTAELQLQQPHVVRLESRPANIEGAARSPSATWCATRCACGRTASSSASAVAPRRSTCCRR